MISLESLKEILFISAEKELSDDTYIHDETSKTSDMMITIVMTDDDMCDVEKSILSTSWYMDETIHDLRKYDSRTRLTKICGARDEDLSSILDRAK